MSANASTSSRTATVTICPNGMTVGMADMYASTFQIVQFGTGASPADVPADWLKERGLIAENDEPTFDELCDAASTTGANGCPYWESYVAGLDPTNANSRFTAKITINASTGKPEISWIPELSATEAARRTYKKYGKVKLTDANWTEIAGNEENYNFFKVSVEMK